MRTRKAEREAAAKGAALLDERMPGWHARIDLDRLDLADGKQCVLGQLFPEPITVTRWQEYGHLSLDSALTGLTGLDRESKIKFMSAEVCVSNYEAGRIVLDVTQSPGEFGFDVHEDNDERHSTRYSGLDLAWADEVRRRQT